MSALDRVREALPEAAKDIRVNLQNVLQNSTLTPAQRWGVAYAVALAAKSAPLAQALEADARSTLEADVVDGVLEDARAAAVLMAMNNIYYRFRHVVGKPEYGTKPVRLRMTRLVQPATHKLDMELFALAVSAVNNCESCVRGHEKAVIDGGLSEDHVNDAIRVAATVNAAAMALALSGEQAQEPQVAA